MRQGETLFFYDNGGEGHRAKVSAVLFTGTSRYIPDDTGEPWRELLIIETVEGNLVVRDRMRVSSGDEIVSQDDPEWHYGDHEIIVDLLSGRVLQSAGDDLRLYSRALRALEKWAKAVAV